MHNVEIPFLLLARGYCSDQIQEVGARLTYGEEEERICGKYEEWRLLGRLGVVDGTEINGFLRKWNGVKWDG